MSFGNGNILDIFWTRAVNAVIKVINIIMAIIFMGLSNTFFFAHCNIYYYPLPLDEI